MLEEFLSSTPSHCSTRVMCEGSPKHRTASAFPKSVQIQGKRKRQIKIFSSLSLSAGEEVNESKIKARSQCDGREEEDGGGEEEAESKEKKTSCSQEHLLAQRKESNYNLTKSPSTGLTKYLTGSWHFPKYRIFLFLPFFRQLRKAGVESNTDGLCSSPKPNPNVFLAQKSA